MMQWGTKKDAKRDLGGETDSLISMISFCAMGELNFGKRIPGKTKDLDTHNLHGTQFFVCFQSSNFLFF